jgi:membrane-bound lytic murein transglycosylase B
MKYTIITTIASAAFVLLSIIPNNASGRDPAFDPLVARLIGDGMDSLRIRRLFDNPRITFQNNLVLPNMIPQDHPDAYRGFTEDKEVDDGVRFLLKRNAEITSLLDGTQIPPEIIVAILKIESDLGRNAGDHPVLAVFATLSLLNDPKHWKTLADTCRSVGIEHLKRRAEKRSRWAYGELSALLEICRRFAWDPVEIRGSWAGAFGAAQFLPSSYAHCARDGDGDGTVDPYDLDDAVAAIICYLEDAGWRESSFSHRRALHRYNPSNAYVDAVLNYASRLKERLRVLQPDNP